MDERNLLKRFEGIRIREKKIARNIIELNMDFQKMGIETEEAERISGELFVENALLKSEVMQLRGELARQKPLPPKLSWLKKLKRMVTQ